jgi:hypothetical protein
MISAEVPMARGLHDPKVRSSIEARVGRLAPGARGRWGRMTVDQMLWHINQSMAHAVGEGDAANQRAPLPKALVKFLVLNLTWPRNAPTNRSFVAAGTHDFETERARCLRLIATIASRPAREILVDHPMFGPMRGDDVGRLQAKHLDHHLRQFGA